MYNVDSSLLAIRWTEENKILHRYLRANIVDKIMQICEQQTSDVHIWLFIRPGLQFNVVHASRCVKNAPAAMHTYMNSHSTAFSS